MLYGHSPYARLCVFYKTLQSQTNTSNFISSTRLGYLWAIGNQWNLVGIKIKQNKMSRSWLRKMTSKFQQNQYTENIK